MEKEDLERDLEQEEYLTESLENLYEKWKDLSGFCGTEEEKKEWFCRTIKIKLKKGFSVLSVTGSYSNEGILSGIVKDLYDKWKSYAKIEDLDTSIDTNINIFVSMVRAILDAEDVSVSWLDID